MAISTFQSAIVERSSRRNGRRDTDATTSTAHHPQSTVRRRRKTAPTTTTTSSSSPFSTVLMSCLIVLAAVVLSTTSSSSMNGIGFRVVMADQQQNDDYSNYVDDANGGGQAGNVYYDDAYAADHNSYGNDDGALSYSYDASDNSIYSAGDESITYWTDYAILPKRCITYGKEDVIVFSVHEEGYKQCTDEPVGTYITPVPNFLQGYLKYYMQIQEDKGNKDYQLPDAAQYAYCQRIVIQNKEYWLQMGCTDGNSLSLSVNIYEDNTCTKRSTVGGFDDANIDVSEIKLPFKHCQACVMWVDKNDDEIDDMFYENRQTNAPLCSTAWNYKATCNRKCQHTGLEHESKEGWNTADKVLLAVLAAFGLVMLIVILKKRQNMSNKDSLLEQAAMSAAGLQQAHVIGIFFLYIIVITVFALLQLKNITWAMLLIMNTALFGYLMKLTVDSGISTGEAVIGPDGTIIRNVDSDESSVESNTDDKKNLAGTYHLPQIA